MAGGGPADDEWGNSLPPHLADLAMAVVVAVFTGADAAVNDPGYRRAVQDPR
ncbi:hypothetical protein HRW07_22895 [Streptomyces lunaelactis]|uniref:hypothetical protein n=1 Tax=Streptomyces lunaelactis TaxID=1535768 RepID=UPI0015848376|nr:hypothetical protein [Streptomyces lunaelactis]NUL06022.1 hypothetical protein [Streptomyces lunaelactis]